MTPISRTKPSHIKVRVHRKRLRKLGLRPLQIWVPDVRAPAFRAEARRQSRAVAASSIADQDQSFIDAITTIDEQDGSNE